MDEISVRRIHVLEPDGTIRMVISGTQEAPGIYFHNKERPHVRPAAGRLRHIQDQGTVTALMINDVPVVPKDPALLAPLATLEGESREKLLEGLRATGMFDSNMRMFAGRSRSGDAMLSLHDAEGRPRLYFRVSEDGEVSVQVLDAEGAVVRDLLEAVQDAANPEK